MLHDSIVAAGHKTLSVRCCCLIWLDGNDGVHKSRRRRAGWVGRVVSSPSSLPALSSPSTARCHIKMFLLWKIRRGEIITVHSRIWYVYLLLKYRPPHKKSPHYKIAPRKVSPADNLQVKIRLAWAAAGRVGFLPVNCRPGETFLSDDPTMGYRRLRSATIKLK